ncbi:serine/threonine protein kinase bud32 [Histoplasma capsulatum var. duboisii H88]|uniref:non-specific serine/threonine protein kinase n=1 Tax=Ajellomyces capsulatus (strain H88) TaxID=544711 RepID=F0UPK5_AJEC8|nr:serine/threonine protein kinase bud32 [Histoplasma capsulatum var. duboisii H88]
MSSKQRDNHHLIPFPPLPAPFTKFFPLPSLAQGAEGRLYKNQISLTPFHPPPPLKSPPRKNPTDTLNRTGWSAWLLMEWVEGIVVRQVVDRWEKWLKSREKAAGPADAEQDDGAAESIRKGEEDICALLRRIGLVVGAMHRAGIVHGDLTTSNLILRPIAPVSNALSEEDAQGAEASGLPMDTPIRQDAELQSTATTATTTNVGKKPSLEGEIVLIDFGLASQSIQDEDRAVDLYVLERAFGSSHPRTEPFFHEVLKGYAESYKTANVVLKKLEQVRLRGRKRSMVG